jgi:hypothetical protein
MRVDGDGVRIYEAPAPQRNARTLALLFVAALLSLSAAWMLLPDRPSDTPAPAVSSQASDAIDASSDAIEPAATANAAPASAAAPRRALRAVYVSRNKLTRDERREAAGATDPEPEIDAKDAIEALVAAGETEGIAAFPPPGTDPVKSGIVVPDDFPLPEGYVRHYQTTDDGERLDAILMFSPDYEFTDPEGRPIVVPDDGIVPPDMAPPDLPIRMLETPRKRGAGRTP